MKSAPIFAFVLLLVSAGTFAKTPGEAPLSAAALASILGGPVGTGPCAFASSKPTGFSITCSVNCGLTTLSCPSGTSTCTVVDRNCTTGEPGSVTCDGVTSQCYACGTSSFCVYCSQKGDCYDCCRCDGGTFDDCAHQCFDV